MWSKDRSEHQDDDVVDLVKVGPTGIVRHDTLPLRQSRGALALVSEVGRDRFGFHSLPHQETGHLKDRN